MKKFLMLTSILAGFAYNAANAEQYYDDWDNSGSIRYESWDEETQQYKDITSEYIIENNDDGYLGHYQIGTDEEREYRDRQYYAEDNMVRPNIWLDVVASDNNSNEISLAKREDSPIRREVLMQNLQTNENISIENWSVARAYQESNEEKEDDDFLEHRDFSFDQGDIAKFEDNNALNNQSANFNMQYSIPYMQ